jgi:enoyl-[acyl-carrier protein] reductase II
MFHTELCRKIGMTYPIAQAPMNWATDKNLVAAVSNAGGLGVLGPNAGISKPTKDPELMAARLKDQIRGIREKTSKPFAVNIPIGRGHRRIYSDRLIDVVIDEDVPIVVTVTGSPQIYTERLKRAGIIVIHAISSVYHAKKAEACGVDIVVAEGYDGGGHSGFDQIPTASLVSQVVQNVKIPVVAAGGIVDGNGLIAALALGAQAVYMGTRFMATKECPIHSNVKQAIVTAKDNSTVSWGKKIEIARSLKNQFTEKYNELELAGFSLEELKQFIRNYHKFGYEIGRRPGALKFGDLEDGEVFFGTGAGQIKEISPAKEVIILTMHQAKEKLERLNQLSLMSKK